MTSSCLRAKNIFTHRFCWKSWYWSFWFEVRNWGIGGMWGFLWNPSGSNRVNWLEKEEKLKGLFWTGSCGGALLWTGGTLLWTGAPLELARHGGTREKFSKTSISWSALYSSIGSPSVRAPIPWKILTVKLIFKWFYLTP